MSSSTNPSDDSPARNTRFAHLRRPSSTATKRASPAPRRKVKQEPSEVEPLSSSFEENIPAAIDRQVKEDVAGDMLRASAERDQTPTIMSPRLTDASPSPPASSSQSSSAPASSAPASSPTRNPPNLTPGLDDRAHLLSLLRLDHATSSFFGPTLAQYYGTWVRNSSLLPLLPHHKLDYANWVICGASSFLIQHAQDIMDLQTCLQVVRSGRHDPLADMDIKMPQFKEIWRTTQVDIKMALRVLAVLVAPHYPDRVDGLRRGDPAVLLELAEQRVHTVKYEKALVGRQLFLCGVQEPDTVRRHMPFVPLRPLAHRNSALHAAELMQKICILHDITDENLDPCVPTEYEAETADQRHTQETPTDAEYTHPQTAFVVPLQDMLAARTHELRRQQTESTLRPFARQAASATAEESNEVWELADPGDIAYETLLMEMEWGR